MRGKWSLECRKKVEKFAQNARSSELGPARAEQASGTARSSRPGTWPRVVPCGVWGLVWVWRLPNHLGTIGNLDFESETPCMTKINGETEGKFSIWITGGFYKSRYTLCVLECRRSSEAPTFSFIHQHGGTKCVTRRPSVSPLNATNYLIPSWTSSMFSHKSIWNEFE